MENSSSTTQLSTQPQLSGFEKLPQELRDEIYGYLLVSTEVKEALTYRFHTAILATNRRISEEAQEVLFRQNTFIVVSTNWSFLAPFMKFEGVAMISNHGVKTITQHHLSVIVDITGIQSLQRTLVDEMDSFLIVAEDLPLFTRYLGMMNLVHGATSGGFRVKLEVRATKLGNRRPALQKRLLEPFKDVRGAYLTATLEGEVDPAYRAEVLRAMLPRIPHGQNGKVQADRWHMYRLAKMFKIEGDEAFKAGDLRRALDRYSRMLRFEGKCRRGLGLEMAPHLVDPADLDNLRFRVSADNLDMRAEINLKLVRIRMRDFGDAEPDGGRLVLHMAQLVWLKPWECSRLLLYTGMIEVEHWRSCYSCICFETALRYTPDDATVQICLDLLTADWDDAVFEGTIDDHQPIEEPEVDLAEQEYYESARDESVDE